MKAAAPAGAVLFVLALAGCNDTAGLKPEKIKLHYGYGMLLSQGQVSNRPVRLEVLTGRLRGILGGKGERRACPGIEIKFETGDDRLRFLEKQDGEAFGSLTVATDAGGEARAYLLSEGVPGTITYRVTAVDPETGKPFYVNDSPLSMTLTAHNGISVTSPPQVAAGKSAAIPIEVRIAGSDKEPVFNRKVLFHVADTKAGKVSYTRVSADSEGSANTGFTAGSGTGTSVVQVQVEGFESFDVKIFRYDTFQIIIGVIAGLAIFLFGMKAMSDGLKELAGERIRKVLQFLTTNRWTGLVVGTLVTGVIQSSSAMTVMVIGFVNAGLMQLEQAISLVIGANIGTTFTAQLISFKLTHMALPAVAAGVAMMFFGKRPKVKQWGRVLAGFGFLFYGLTMMSHQLKPLADSRTVMNSLRWMDCSPNSNGHIPLMAPVLALGIGTLMTIVIQSSSATIGLLIVAASSGLVNFYTAVPILWGDNIGTTITANLAAIGSNTTARRSAIAHALFNIIGVSIMLPLFYVTVDSGGHAVPIYLYFVDMTVAGNPFSATHENISRHIANAHTLFNVINAGIFIFLVGPLARLVSKIIPDRAEREPAHYLETHLLDTPPLALSLVVRELGYMARLARKSFKQAVNSLVQADDEKVEKLLRREEKLDDAQDRVTEYLSKLAVRPLSIEQSKCIPLMLHAVNDLERIGDHCEDLVKLSGRRIERKIEFSDVVAVDLMDLQEQVIFVFDKLLDGIMEDDITAAAQALVLQRDIKRMMDKLEDGHARRQGTGECLPNAAAVFNETMMHIEQIASHMINVAEIFIELHHWRELSDPEYPDATRKKARKTQAVEIAGSQAEEHDKEPRTQIDKGDIRPDDSDDESESPEGSGGG